MKKAFVDRIEELRHLNRALKYDEKKTPVLVFTGIGGMGKTALRIAFEEQILKPNEIPYAVLDYDGDPNLRPIEGTLRTIRRHLGKHKVKTPVFDFLYARYFELSTGFKFSKKNYPPELEGVVAVLTGIPGFGNVPKIIYGLSKIGLAVRERLLHKEWLYRIRDLEPREVLNLLPEVLAEDLEEAMTVQKVRRTKQSGYRIPLLFDAYEFLADSHIDDTLHRKFFLMTPHLLRVIFTRAPLRWEHAFPHEWRDQIMYIPPLDNLYQEDATILLRKRHVDNTELQEHLFQLTGGYPLHLELCADICREIKAATKREPEVQDFEGAAQAKNLTEELINRLLRQLTDNESDLMRLAAYPRWVSEEILEVLSSVPESVPRIFEKFTKLSMFSPHAEISDAYVIRKEVRDCLLQRQRRERLFKQRHAQLSAFHKGRLKGAQSSLHLREAVYHGFYENSEQTMKLFEAHFWKLLEKFSFAEAESLLEAIPFETITKKQKRRIDYARARLLASMAHSQESLVTAKRIYEMLIDSETEQIALAEYFFFSGDLLRQYMSEYDRALEHFQKALDIYVKTFGVEHPKVAASYNNIGMVYGHMGNYKKALEYFQKSLTIALKVLGEGHPDVAFCYNSIGVVCNDMGDYEKALKYYQKAIAIWLKLYGAEYPGVITAYNNVGVVYDNLGNSDKALEYYQKSLAIGLKVLGEEHLSISRCYNNIGILHRESGEYEQALECFHKDLSICLRILGDEHPDVAMSYNNIGIVYASLGNYEKALEYFERSLTIRLKVFGSDHPLVAQSFDNIGCASGDLGKFERALKCFQKVLTILLKVHGDEHPKVALAYYNIGCAFYKKEEYGVALDNYQNALMIQLKVLGEGDPCVAESFKAIGNTLWMLKKNEEALNNMHKSVKIYRKFNRWNNALEGLETLLKWLEELGRNQEAEELRTEIQRIQRDKGAHGRE